MKPSGMRSWRRCSGEYPTGFDCDCMPEEGLVERLVIYLCKYVSSPPISIRRIEGYDGQNVSYRYEDHRKGLVTETIAAVEFIGRMIQHLPPKGFRLVLRSEGLLRRVARDIPVLAPFLPAAPNFYFHAKSPSRQACQSQPGTSGPIFPTFPLRFCVISSFSRPTSALRITRSTGSVRQGGAA